jgi:hypothetical protein
MLSLRSFFRDAEMTLDDAIFFINENGYALEAS